MVPYNYLNIYLRINTWEIRNWILQKYPRYYVYLQSVSESFMLVSEFYKTQLIYIMCVYVIRHSPIVSHSDFYLIPINLNFHDVVIKMKHCGHHQNLLKWYLRSVGGRWKPSILVYLLASYPPSNVTIAILLLNIFETIPCLAVIYIVVFVKKYSKFLIPSIRSTQII